MSPIMVLTMLPVRTGAELPFAGSVTLVSFSSGARCFDQGNPRVHLLPGRAHPDVIGIFCIGELASAPRQAIQVIDVVSMAGDYRMKTVPNQDHIAIPGSDREIARPVPRVEALVSVALRAIDAIVVNFVEVNFGRGVVYVMLVRREAGPVSARGIDLHQHEFIRGKLRRHHVYDLARGIAAPAKTGVDILGSD